MSYQSHKYPQFNSFCAGIDPEDHYWASEVHMHTVEELLLLTHTGSCRVISNGNSYQIPTPAFLWNRAGSFHLVEEVDGIATGSQIVFHPGIFSDLHKQLLRTDFMEDSGLFALPLDEENLKRLQLLFLSARGSPFFQRQLLLPCIFHQVTQGLKNGLEPIRSGNTQGYLFDVIRLLRSPGPEKLTIEALADQFHVGTTKLKTDFKKITGTTIHKFRLQQQVYNARTLLASTKLPMAQIAIDCGFTDESHLVRAFRKEHGTTPGTFRKKYTADHRSAK